ncbi:MAG: SHOCT domain-containing protein [Halobellus sp.]|uniref:SHOCT domain-containing protein n=1 Tax=Halobellus sp. TaxID=1979212 RepID=UPI0035D4C4E2
MDGRRDTDSPWWTSPTPADSDDPVVAATVFLVLGAGLGSLFGVPILAAVDFWMFFAIGYAVVVPLVSLIRGHRGSDSVAAESSADGKVDRMVDERDREVSDAAEGAMDAALSRLRDRYARGDLSDEQFERKLEVLLETDTPENARERAERDGTVRSEDLDDADPAGPIREPERDSEHR